jgi:hypothetical protein
MDVSNAVLVVANEYIAPLNGDFDLDGDVDFPDFLGFTTNFGKKGPAPSQGFPITPLLLRIPVSGTNGGTDTIVITVIDTIEITNIDTVTIGDTAPGQDTVFVTLQNRVEVTAIETVFVSTSQDTVWLNGNPATSDQNLQLDFSLRTTFNASRQNASSGSSHNPSRIASMRYWISKR